MAVASSHILYPLGIGQLDRQLRQLPDHPWGLPCSARRTCRRRRVPLCPGGGLSCRWADYRPAHPLHIPCWSAPVSRFGSFDFTRCAGVHYVPHSVFPLARSPGAAPRGQYVSACFTPLRYQRRMTPMRRGGQDRLGQHDQSCLTTFTSHLEAVGCSAWFGAALASKAQNISDFESLMMSQRLRKVLPCGLEHRSHFRHECFEPTPTYWHAWEAL
jgi:hypothetical protein